MTSVLPIVAPTAELYFEDLLVARVENVISSDGSYWGKFHLAVNDMEPGLPSRIVSFVRFCIDWNERALAHPHPNHTEFDQFGELIGPNKWRVIWPGESIAISDAPIFFIDNYMGW